MLPKLKLRPHKVKGVPLDDERITLGMAEAVDFEVYVEIGPFNGFRTTHLHVKHAADGSVLHPRDTIVRQEIVMSQHREHDSLRINHQYACRYAVGIVFALASEYWTHLSYLFGCKYTKSFPHQEPFHHKK